MWTCLRRFFRAQRAKRAIRAWEAKGRPIPPPSEFKQTVVQEYARRFQLPALVETGTFLGQMIEAVRKDFRRLYSIELDEALHRRAQQRFAGDESIRLLRGDSGEMIRSVLQDVKTPCLFWLDAHYSEGITAKGSVNTPVLNELEIIFKMADPASVVLIDDARLFVGRDDYPTLEQVQAIVAQRRPQWAFSVKDDIIRLHP